MKRLNKQGFTLIEVVVVMAIIAVLAVLIIGAITVARRTSTETQHRSNASTMRAGLEAYYAKNKNYPTIVSGTTFTSAIGTGANQVDVTLGSSGCNGGGTILSAATAYTLTTQNYNCTATLETVSGP